MAEGKLIIGITVENGVLNLGIKPELNQQPETKDEIQLLSIANAMLSGATKGLNDLFAHRKRIRTIEIKVRMKK